MRRVSTVFGVFVVVLSSGVLAQSAGQFEKIIKSHASATQRVCMMFGTPVDRLPAIYNATNSNKPYFRDYRVLEKYGYVRITKIKTADPSTGRSIDAYKVEKTDKWDKEIRTNKFNGEWCYGTWSADKVKSFTPPVDGTTVGLPGTRYTEVTVIGKQKYLPWASKPELRRVIGVPDLPATAEKQFGLYLKSGVWQIYGNN